MSLKNVDWKSKMPIFFTEEGKLKEKRLAIAAGIVVAVVAIIVIAIIVAKHASKHND